MDDLCVLHSINVRSFTACKTRSASSLELPTERDHQLFIAVPGFILHLLVRDGDLAVHGEQGLPPVRVACYVLHNGLCYVRGKIVGAGSFGAGKTCVSKLKLLVLPNQLGREPVRAGRALGIGCAGYRGRCQLLQCLRDGEGNVGGFLACFHPNPFH